MATVKAKAEITMFNVKDVKSVTRYYLLQSSTDSAPTKPTTITPGGSWSTTEPSYTSGSTNTLYFVDLTIMSDGKTFSYSDVSKSSSYEAAKAAYNKATNVETTMTKFKQTSEGWQMNWDKILNGKEANTNKHTDYITFKDGNIKLGDSASTKTLEISNEDVQIRNGEDPVASFGEKIVLGVSNDIYITISNLGMEIYRKSSGAPIAQMLWGKVSNNEGALIEGPYYSLGSGRNTESGIGASSLVEGIDCTASQVASHAEGFQTNATGCHSHAEGFWTLASGNSSHAEGGNTEASGACSHAGNDGSVASGDNSTAINGGNASGEGSFAVFPGSQAKHTYAAAMGQGVVTGKNNQTVIGYYNDPNLNTSALLVVGAGQDANNRRNVFAVGMDGSIWSAAGTYNGVDIGNYVYREGRGSQFNTSTPLLINGDSLNMALAQLILQRGDSYIRLRNDGGAFYIMNGNASGWTNFITFYTGGGIVVPNTLNVPTQLYIPYATKASTTSAANAYISADGNGVLAKTSKTSSRRFKDSITPELDEDLNPERLYDVDVIQFKYKKDYFTNEDDIRYRKNMIGLIAEDVYDKYKIAADWHVDEDSGEVLVDGWNEQYIIPALLKLIQNQHKELQEQRKEIDQLKETVGMLVKEIHLK